MSSSIDGPRSSPVNRPNLPFSAAADRNKQPILEVLEQVFPAGVRVLEIASGNGQHAEFFARTHPYWQWQPSDGDPGCLDVIARRCAGITNVRPPLHFDVLKPGVERRPGLFDSDLFDSDQSDSARYDAIYCANMLHISPWASCAALMQHSATVLEPGGVLAIYGPFAIEGQVMAPGNVAFDADLRARNPDWGIRHLGEVQREAKAAGLTFDRKFPMPANNLMLIWRHDH